MRLLLLLSTMLLVFRGWNELESMMGRRRGFRDREELGRVVVRIISCMWLFFSPHSKMVQNSEIFLCLNISLNSVLVSDGVSFTVLCCVPNPVEGNDNRLYPKLSSFRGRYIVVGKVSNLRIHYPISVSWEDKKPLLLSGQ